MTQWMDAVVNRLADDVGVVNAKKPMESALTDLCCVVLCCVVLCVVLCWIEMIYVGEQLHNLLPIKDVPAVEQQLSRVETFYLQGELTKQQVLILSITTTHLLLKTKFLMVMNRCLNNSASSTE